MTGASTGGNTAAGEHGAGDGLTQGIAGAKEKSGGKDDDRYQDADQEHGHQQPLDTELNQRPVDESVTAAQVC